MSAPAARADQPHDVIANFVGTLDALRSENKQLKAALTSRIAIEQAKGVLAERLAIGPEDAFILLRRSARSSRVKLHDLAAAVVASRETPPEIRLVLERWEQRLDPAAVR
ncbi:MAG: ANTAR domain-containing protein [Thermoleophilia bacterium]